MKIARELALVHPCVSDGDRNDKDNVMDSQSWAATYGLQVSTLAKPLIPASVVIRTTGLLPGTVHLRSMIFIRGTSRMTG
jgi:hypothetical protein